MSAGALVSLVIFIGLGSLGACGVVEYFTIRHNRKKMRKEGWKW